MRSRYGFCAFALLAGFGMVGCKCMHSDTSSTAPAAASCADGSCTAAATRTTTSTKAPTAASTGCSACASCATCASCRAPSTPSSMPTMAAIASDSGCSTCAAKTLPTILTPVAATGPVTAEPILVTTTMPTTGPTTTLPSVPGPGVLPATLPPALATTTPTPLGPGVETVSSGGPPILLANGDKLIPQSTMTVRFGESDNYQTLVGQVSQFRHTWRLRYTAVESEDKLGGSVILVGNDLDQLKDGQMVRVQGSVLPGDDRATGTRYQVTHFDVIEPGK